MLCRKQCSNGTSTKGHMTNGKYSGQKILRRARFGGDVSAWRFRCRRLGADVSAWTFRRAGFAVEVSARLFRQRQIVWYCRVWTRHIVLFALSCLENAHCPVWKRRSVLCGNDTLSCLETTHCPARKRHIVFFGKHASSSLEKRHRPSWEEHIVLLETTNCLSGNDKFSL